MSWDLIEKQVECCDDAFSSFGFDSSAVETMLYVAEQISCVLHELDNIAYQNGFDYPSIVYKEAMLQNSCEPTPENMTRLSLETVVQIINDTLGEYGIEASVKDGNKGLVVNGYDYDADEYDFLRDLIEEKNQIMFRLPNDMTLDLSEESLSLSYIKQEDGIDVEKSFNICTYEDKIMVSCPSDNGDRIRSIPVESVEKAEDVLRDMLKENKEWKTLSVRVDDIECGTLTKDDLKENAEPKHTNTIER